VNLGIVQLRGGWAYCQDNGIEAIFRAEVMAARCGEYGMALTVNVDKQYTIVRLACIP
jgi:hypothetical protein